MARRRNVKATDRITPHLSCPVLPACCNIQVRPWTIGGVQNVLQFYPFHAPKKRRSPNTSKTRRVRTIADIESKGSNRQLSCKLPKERLELTDSSKSPFQLHSLGFLRTDRDAPTATQIPSAGDMRVCCVVRSVALVDDPLHGVLKLLLRPRRPLSRSEVSLQPRPLDICSILSRCG